MKISVLHFISIVLVFLIGPMSGSCQYKPDKEAVDLVKTANEIGRNSLYKDSVKVEEALALIDHAIEIDHDFFGAYQSKATFLAVKKDIDALIANNLEMIRLRPEQPAWRIQRGLLLDVKGEREEAGENYDLGLKKFRELLKQKDLQEDFNFRIEYISALEAKQDFTNVRLEIAKLKSDFPDNEMVQFYIREFKPRTRAELLDFWKTGS